MCTVAVIAVLLTATDSDDHNSLPRDGSWARYHVVVKRKDQGTEGTYKLVISSVGTAQEADQQCRWIELKFEEPDGTEYVCKLLITEEGLIEGASPTDGLKRAWLRLGGQVSEIDAARAQKYATALLFVPGVLRDAKRAEERRIVEYQHGRLQMDSVYRGRREVNYPSTNSVWKTRYSVWLHRDIPIGFAAARTDTEVRKDNALIGSIVTEYLLEDTGLDAKTTLDWN